MPPKSVKVKSSATRVVKRTRSSSPPPTPPRAPGAAQSPRSKTPPSPARSSTAPLPSAVTPQAIRLSDDTPKTEQSIWSEVEPFKRRTEEKDFDANGMLKLITWNVAGLRGLLRNNAEAIRNLLLAEEPHALCLQETKLNPDDPQNKILGVVPGYSFVDHACRAKKGYSGTRTYIKESLSTEWTLTNVRGFGSLSDAQSLVADNDDEGRVLTTYFSNSSNKKAGNKPFQLALINTYVPNSGMDLARLPYRYTTFDVKMRQHLCALSDASGASGTNTTASASDGTPPLVGFIWAGDLNVAERDYDRYFAVNYKSMQKCSGFTPEERASFRETLRATNSVDTFRMLYPKAAPVYTFWSARLNGRARGLGWRLDYFVVSATLASRVVDCFTMPQIMGSDHCPVQMWLRR